MNTNDIWVDKHEKIEDDELENKVFDRYMAWFKDKIILVKYMRAKPHGHGTYGAFVHEQEIADNIDNAKSMFTKEHYDILKEMLEKEFPLKCPEKGSFVGYKKCVVLDKSEQCGFFGSDCDLNANHVLVTLEIPSTSRRSSAFGNKCRCESAKVIDIIGINADPYDRTIIHYESAISGFVPHGPQLLHYIKNGIVVADSFDDNRWRECSHGIHFFMEPEEAINYW